MQIKIQSFHNPLGEKHRQTPKPPKSPNQLPHLRSRILEFGIKK